MKFYTATVLLAVLCTLAFSQEEGEGALKAENWSMPPNTVNENTTAGGRPGNRIIGGREAYLGLIPYQAGFIWQLNGVEMMCGGSLIAPNWILTAAHCVKGSAYFKVSLGTVKFNTGGQYFYSTTAFYHTGYNTNTGDNDIALIKLPSNAVYNSYVRPIRIADSSLSFSSVRASGWGRTSNGNTATTLRYADLPNFNIYLCAIYYPGLVTANFVCTRSFSGENVCRGDSGGPLVDNNSKQLVGISSFVYDENCNVDKPAAFVKASSYRDWIRRNTGIYTL